MTSKYAFQCYLICDLPDGEASFRVGDLFSSKHAAEAAAKRAREGSANIANFRKFNRVDVCRVQVSYAKWASVYVAEVNAA
jgi:hypothetical protein